MGLMAGEGFFVLFVRRAGIYFVVQIAKDTVLRLAIALAFLSLAAFLQQLVYKHGERMAAALIRLGYTALRLMCFEIRQPAMAGAT